MVQPFGSFTLRAAYPMQSLQPAVAFGRTGDGFFGAIVSDGFAGGPRQPVRGKDSAKRLAARRGRSRVPDQFDAWLDQSLKTLFEHSPEKPLPPELAEMLKPAIKPKDGE